jgi:hypothetical protein
MALIPNDVGLLMRLQTDSRLLQPLQPVSEIPSDILALRPGQTFSARIQEALPENTYKALVAGKSLTLSLPEGAKTGDTLELVVIDRSPRVVVAQLAAKSTSADANQPYQFTTLSRAGQLIGGLLPAEGEAVAPAALNRGQPLLAQAPLTGGQLVPALETAVKQSGLFYESHQAQWVTGRLPLQQLLQEPQAQHSNLAVLLAANGATTASTANATPWDALQKSVLTGRQDEPPSLLQTLLGRSPNTAATETAETANSPNLLRTVATAPGGTTAANSAADATPAANSSRALAQSSQSIPDDLRPIVQQQLDAVATQRLAWHGEVWPNQHMQWEVDWQSGNNNAEDEEEQVWGTTLSLTTPRLGDVQARLQLTTAGVRIAIVTPIGATAADLRDAAPVLEQSLAAAGVPLLGFLVKHDDQQA